MARKPRDKAPAKEAPAGAETTQHIASVGLDESLAARTIALSHERQVAISDLIEWNHFALKGTCGPYTLTLKSAGNNVTFDIRAAGLEEPESIVLPLAPFRGIIRDYFLICESYFEAVKVGNLARIEAIDMSRRGLHNEGSDLLTELMKDRIDMDSGTARRLFTLLAVLHMK